MRHFQRGIRKLKAPRFSGHEAKGGRIPFLGMAEGDLQTKANTQDRHPLGKPASQGFSKPRARQRSHGATGLAHPGENDALCSGEVSRIGADHRRKTDFSAGALHTPEVSGVVVDDNRFRHWEAPRV